MTVARTVLPGLLISLLIVVFNSGVAGASHLADPFGEAVHQAGPEEMVFDHTDESLPGFPLKDACTRSHIADAPVRAFKDPSGLVQMIVSHGYGEAPDSMSQTRRMTGPSLNNLTVSCALVHYSDNSTLPQSYTNNEWLASTYIMPDGTVMALVHNEYQGYRDAVDPQCTLQATNCWWNSITTAYAGQDGPGNYGSVYSHALPPHHRVATFPYAYEPNMEAVGYFQPTNIVKMDDGYYYAMFRVYGHQSEDPNENQAQQDGTCLMRTSTFQAFNWRAWDGDGFDVRFKDPYDTGDTSAPEDHVCAPVSYNQIPAMSGNLIYSTYLERWVLIDLVQAGNDNTSGIWYSTSPDLKTWTQRKMLLRANVLGDIKNGQNVSGCSIAPANAYLEGQKNMVGHPALLDADSTDANFTTVGQTGYLYITKFNCQSGPLGHLNRDLVRIPIRFGTARRADGHADGCVYGFDRHVNTGPSTFTLDSTQDYTGGGAYKASMVTGQTFGVFDREGTPPFPPNCEDPNNSPRPSIGYSEGDEVWYNGAFYFPSTGFWDEVTGAATISVLKLQAAGSTPGWGGMFMIRGDGNLRFSTNDGVNPRHNVLFGPAGSLGINLVNKEDCWHFFEVHQKFSSDENKAVNEVWVDGVKRTNEDQSTTVNYFGTPWREIRAGLFNKGAGVGQPHLFTDALVYNSVGPTYYLGCEN